MTKSIETDALTRRGFIGIAAVSAAALPAAGALTRREEPPALGDRFPSQEYEAVRDTVAGSHGNVPRVTELVEARPALARATIDWGFGDWESAIGAASHVGNREIAALLISHGARPDIFTGAMMGWVDAVRGMVTAQPGVQRLLGPHGFTLAHHARVGGDDAALVREYLDELGDADNAYERPELSEAEQAVYTGTYEHASGTLEVLVTRFGLAIKSGTGFSRTLVSLGAHAFHPVGAEHVRVIFEVRDDAARSVTIHDPGPIVTATRAAG
ncbi:MAG: hypothetical protein RIB60_09815 [Phycisphaerales bacterium]